MRISSPLKKWHAFLVGSVLALSPLYSYACFTIIAGKSATASNAIILARTSDSKDTRRSKNFKIYTNDNDDKLYTGLPYSESESNPYSDMAQVTTNRFGVAMSATQTIQNNLTSLTLDPSSTNGVSESTIPMLVMPTATNAREGILLLGNAIEQQGVSEKGFGVLIGDQNEAWYLETLSGHQWVAVRIPDTMYFVAANGPGQIQEYMPEQYTYLLSHFNGIDPITFARNHNIAHFDSRGFNFRSTYGNIQPATDDISNTVRSLFAQSILTPSSQPFNEEILTHAPMPPMFLTPDTPITIDTLKAIQSSYYEAFPMFDAYKNNTPHPHFRPISNFRTSNAHITEISPSKGDYSISNLEYIALGMPCLSVYLPIYYGLTDIPHQLINSTNEADDNSLFWQFRKLQVLVFLSDPNKGIPYAFNARKTHILNEYKTLKQFIDNAQHQLITSYTKDQNPEYINHFTQTIVDEVSRVNQQLISYFLQKLDIDNRYGLTTQESRNLWFTQMVREQECLLRSVGESQCA